MRQNNELRCTTRTADNESVQAWTGPIHSNYCLRMKDLDRRISVAPMMDWTDDLKSSFYINGLGLLENPCHLYGTSKFGGSSRLAEVGVKA